MEKGICVAGFSVVDMLYPIDQYPREGELTVINPGIKRATGGALCNVSIDLAKLDPQLPLTAIGQIGTDEYAQVIKEQLGQYGNIDTKGVKEKGETSFSIVMCDQSNNQRTFFEYKGANAEICEEHFDWDRLDVDLLHIGYILLLDALDAEDGQYGTKMARLLAKAQERGVKTSVDIVSEAGNRFRKIVPPALKYTDYCIINEIEAQQATGVLLRDGETLVRENLHKALNALFDMGVSTWAVIHAPEGGYAMDSHGKYIETESLKLPEGYIKGSVGAGDAFCAGVLYGAYRGIGLADSVKAGVGAAACSLSEEDSTTGVRSFEKTTMLYEQMR